MITPRTGIIAALGTLLLSLFLYFSFSQVVPPGYVGILVKMTGEGTGVQNTEIQPRRIFLWWNEKLYTFPTFIQTEKWTAGKHEGKPYDESINFAISGVSVNCDLGITYMIKPGQAPLLFQKFRQSIDEISDSYLRNLVREALNAEGSLYTIEQVYGERRNEFFAAVEKRVRDQAANIGIAVEQVYALNDPRWPKQITDAIIEKLAQIQKTERVKNEEQEAKAEARKIEAAAQGAANAMLTKATAEAEANKLLAHSLTPELVEYQKILRWNGQGPLVIGNSSPLVDMRTLPIVK